MVKKNLLEIYALTVCFAAVILILFNVATGLFDTVRLMNPSLTVSGYEYDRSLSDDAFLRNWPERSPLPDPTSLPKLRANALDAAVQSERRSALRSLIQSLMYILAGAAVFGIHWTLAKRRRQTDLIDS